MENVLGGKTYANNNNPIILKIMCHGLWVDFYLFCLCGILRDKFLGLFSDEMPSGKMLKIYKVNLRSRESCHGVFRPWLPNEYFV